MERYNKISDVTPTLSFLTVFREKLTIAEILSTLYWLIDKYINL